MTHDAVFDRANVYEEMVDGEPHTIYRASSLGSCDAALVRARLGVTPSPPSDLMQERFQEGHDWEAEVITLGLGVDWVQVTTQSALERYGKVVEDQAGLQIETELRWSDKIVRCHPDAIAQDGAKVQGSVVVEAKFFGEELFDATIKGVKERGMLGLGRTRAWQASVEMLSTGLPLYYILAKKKVEVIDGERVVTGIEGFPEVFEWDEPCYGLVGVKMRVAEIEGYVARGEMPTCPVPFDYPCGYWAEHEKVEKEELDDEMLVHLVESYARNQARREAMDTEQAEIRKDIDARLTEVGSDGGKCAGWEIARVAPRPGNVSWGKAYKALAKITRESVNEDEYRGAEVAGGIRMSKIKVEGNK